MPKVDGCFAPTYGWYAHSTCRAGLRTPQTSPATRKETNFGARYQSKYSVAPCFFFTALSSWGPDGPLSNPTLLSPSQLSVLFCFTHAHTVRARAARRAPRAPSHPPALLLRPPPRLHRIRTLPYTPCLDAEVPPVLLAVVPEDLVEEPGEGHQAADHEPLAVLLVLCGGWGW